MSTFTTPSQQVVLWSQQSAHVTTTTHNCGGSQQVVKIDVTNL